MYYYKKTEIGYLINFENNDEKDIKLNNIYVLEKKLCFIKTIYNKSNNKTDFKKIIEKLTNEQNKQTLFLYNENFTDYNL